MTENLKHVLINLAMAACVPAVFILFRDQPPLDQEWETDYFRSSLILVFILFGIIGGTAELAELRKYMSGSGLWIFLSLLATASHIILFMAAMKYAGFSTQPSDEDYTQWPIAVGGFLFTIYFLFEIIFAMISETETSENYRREAGWSDILLALYASFGSVYIWEIMLGNLGLNFQNWAHFIFAEVLPASILFILVIMPFRRFFIIERRLLIRSSNDEILFYLSYIAIICSGMLSLQIR